MKLMDFLDNADHVLETNVIPGGHPISWANVDSYDKYDLTDMEVSITKVEFVDGENHESPPVPVITHKVTLGMYYTNPKIRDMLRNFLGGLGVDYAGRTTSPILTNLLDSDLLGVRLIGRLQPVPDDIQRGMDFVVTNKLPTDTAELLWQWGTYTAQYYHERVFAAFHPKTGKNAGTSVLLPDKLNVDFYQLNADYKQYDVNPNAGLYFNSRLGKSKVSKGEPIFFQETYVEDTKDGCDNIDSLIIHYRTRPSGKKTDA